MLTSYIGIRINHYPPENNISPKNGWLEDDCYLLGWRNLAGARCYVSFREGIRIPI